MFAGWVENHLLLDQGTAWEGEISRHWSLHIWIFQGGGNPSTGATWIAACCWWQGMSGVWRRGLGWYRCTLYSIKMLKRVCFICFVWRAYLSSCFVFYLSWWKTSVPLNPIKCSQCKFDMQSAVIVWVIWFSYLNDNEWLFHVDQPNYCMIVGFAPLPVIIFNFLVLFMDWWQLSKVLP